jgi:hypothetical protein
MIIKLTNATPEYDGKQILINARHILSIFEHTQKISDDVEIKASNIYTVTQQSWMVKETVDEIYSIINK